LREKARLLLGPLHREAEGLEVAKMLWERTGDSQALVTLAHEILDAAVPRAARVLDVVLEDAPTDAKALQAPHQADALRVSVSVERAVFASDALLLMPRSAELLAQRVAIESEELGALSWLPPVWASTRIEQRTLERARRLLVQIVNGVAVDPREQAGELGLHHLLEREVLERNPRGDGR